MNAPTTPTVIYLRLGEPELSAQDRQDLERYYDQLRHYYAIPDGQAVFPNTTTPEQTHPPQPQPQPQTQPRPSRAPRNQAAHPWRAQVNRDRP